MRKLILTALNRNDKLWYEQFIPFIITLKETDYDGDIGVIDYGLSSEAINVLKENNINVFSPLNIVSNLALDRHLSASEIADKFNYDQIAVYDVDMWFPSKRITLFENIKNIDTLYSCPDSQISTFIFDCIRETNNDNYSIHNIENKLSNICKKYGYIWQLGLIVGHKEAWMNYKDYVSDILSKTDYFTMNYGIDTTLFNLYSAEKDKVKPLHKKYNSIPNWEVHFIYKHNKFDTFIIENQNVETIHIPGDFRLEGNYNLSRLNPEFYIKFGKNYRLEKTPLYNIHKHSLTYLEIKPENITLSVHHVKANYITIGLLHYSDMALTDDALFLEVAGESEICLTNPHNKEVSLTYSYHPSLPYDMTDIVKIWKEKQTVFLNKANKYYYVNIKPGEKIFFVTDGIETKDKRTKWIFENLRIIE